MSHSDVLSQINAMAEVPCLVSLKESVILPGETGAIEVDTEHNINAINHAKENQSGDRYVICISKSEHGDWQKYGVIARIVHMLVFNDSRIKVMLQPLKRCILQNAIYECDTYICWLTKLDYKPYVPISSDLKLKSILKKSWNSYINSFRDKVVTVEESFTSYTEIDDVAFRMVSQLSSVANKDREELLNIDSNEELVKAVVLLIEREKEFHLVEEKLAEDVRKAMDSDNRDYAREKKLRILQKELGGSGNPDVNDISEKISHLPLSESNRKKVDSEIKKLEYTPHISPEYSLIQHYLNWVSDIPWGKMKNTEPCIIHAMRVLNRDHFGLEKTKDRIVEALAVQIRTGSVSGNILCLMGPPGVGKTSVGKSIAEATGRDFVRIALGGVKDESEIRGHRKTYVGSMPGKIIKALKQAGSMNPCILLDEIDKVGSDSRGDPSSALLEVLDPEQNCKFNDHFMDLDIDLSKVLFITTANSYNIPGPLLDRMEVIELSGYTEIEKVNIAQKYLIARSTKEHGLEKAEMKFNKSAIQYIIRNYTRESGVRELERMIDKISRKRVREIMEGKEFDVAITKNNINKYLGVEVYDEELMLKKPMVGIVQGLAWTSVGGTMLNIEATSFPGRGKLIHTGSLGDVMQESIQAAISVVRSIGAKHNLDEEYFENIDLHIHLPEGATPKDGPSAGITLCTALVSIVTNIPVKSDVAMTGEVNLRGEVLAIGGLKEKLLAGLQARIKHIIIPKENERELKEMPKEILEGVNIVVADSISQVIDFALVRQPKKSDWPKADASKKSEDKDKNKK